VAVPTVQHATGLVRKKHTVGNEIPQSVVICKTCGWRSDSYLNRFERSQPYTIDEHIMYEHMLPSKAYDKGVA
jgi:hypothetical protein